MSRVSYELAIYLSGACLSGETFALVAFSNPLMAKFVHDENYEFGANG